MSIYCYAKCAALCNALCVKHLCDVDTIYGQPHDTGTNISISQYALNDTNIIA